MVRRLAKRVLEQLAQIVSKNELFEQPGDRPSQATLPKDAWTGPKEDTGEAGE
jgi:hypothetical protein